MPAYYGYAILIVRILPESMNLPDIFHTMEKSSNSDYKRSKSILFFRTIIMLWIFKFFSRIFANVGEMKTKIIAGVLGVNPVN